MCTTGPRSLSSTSALNGIYVLHHLNETLLVLQTSLIVENTDLNNRVSFVKYGVLIHIYFLLKTVVSYLLHPEGIYQSDNDPDRVR